MKINRSLSFSVGLSLEESFIIDSGTDSTAACSSAEDPWAESNEKSRAVATIPRNPSDASLIYGRKGKVR